MRSVQAGTVERVASMSVSHAKAARRGKSLESQGSAVGWLGAFEGPGFDARLRRDKLEMDATANSLLDERGDCDGEVSERY